MFKINIIEKTITENHNALIVKLASKRCFPEDNNKKITEVLMNKGISYKFLCFIDEIPKYNN